PRLTRLPFWKVSEPADSCAAVVVARRMVPLLVEAPPAVPTTIAWITLAATAVVSLLRMKLPALSNWLLMMNAFVVAEPSVRRIVPRLTRKLAVLLPTERYKFVVALLPMFETPEMAMVPLLVITLLALNRRETTPPVVLPMKLVVELVNAPAIFNAGELDAG